MLPVCIIILFSLSLGSYDPELVPQTTVHLVHICLIIRPIIQDLLERE